MTQWIWRMDSIHDALNFSCVRFYETKEAADRAIADLEPLGWLCDAWVEEVPVSYFGALTRSDCVWPMLDTSLICVALDAAWAQHFQRRRA